VSAFGSVLAFNRPVDAATAEQLCAPDRFVEAIVAPGYEPAAFEMLTTRPKWAKSVRLLSCPHMVDARPLEIEYRGISGGMLLQDFDQVPAEEVEGRDWHVVTTRSPTNEQMADLRFAWLVAKHVKSNAIVYAREGTVVGVGAGQMSRVDSVHLATSKAGERAAGAVLASDAFFPFRDGVDAAAQAGIAAIVQPGGSRRDEDSIAACNERGVAMVFTGRRHFRH
jgi:phosphoribosylaminoimidazolecarboxamide formyltransferase/IMP cyclohydrolase